MTDYLDDLSKAGASFLDSEGKKALNDLKNAIPKVPNVDLSANLNVDASSLDAYTKLAIGATSPPPAVAVPHTAATPAPHLTATPPPRKGHHPMIFKRSGTAPYPPHLESVAAAAPTPPSIVTTVEESAPVKYIKGMSPKAKIIAGVASAFGLVWLLKR